MPDGRTRQPADGATVIGEGALGSDLLDDLL
jgi:hypothetical protein